MVEIRLFDLFDLLTLQGALSEMMHDPEKAMFSYESVLRHNPYNVKALTQIASIYRLREQYPKARMAIG